jgi:hypothetical protein
MSRSKDNGPLDRLAINGRLQRVAAGNRCGEGEAGEGVVSTPELRGDRPVFGIEQGHRAHRLWRAATRRGSAAALHLL